MTSVSIEEEVAEFVATQTKRSVEAITLRTTLFGDLGVDGDDSEELVDAFMKRFDVDMGAYRPDRHFGPEGLPPWAPLYWLVLAWRAFVEKESTPESRARLVPIRVQDLIDSARARKWSIAYEKLG